MKLAIGKQIDRDRISAESNEILTKGNIDECLVQFKEDKEWIRDCIFKAINEKELIKYSIVDNVLYGELNLGEE